MPTEIELSRGEEEHRQALRWFQDRAFEKAAQHMEKSLKAGETTERWNDWATTQLGCGRVTEAERGYRRALAMNRENHQAAANLGVLLASQGRTEDAITYLEQGLQVPDEKERASIGKLLSECRARREKVLAFPTQAGIEQGSQASDAQNATSADALKVILSALTQQAEVLPILLRKVVALEKLTREMGGFVCEMQASRQAGAVYVGEHLALCPVLKTLRMYVDTDDVAIAPHLLLRGTWEPEITQAFTALLKPGMRVVDVGANFGYYTLLAASVVGPKGKICAIEPDRRNFEILEKNVHLNGITGIVRLHRVAAAEARRTASLYRDTVNMGSHSLFEISDSRGNPRSRVPTDAVPLDELVREPVDVIKIDAEGSEPLIFAGMRELLARSPKVKIMMEFYPDLIRKAGVDPAAFLHNIQEVGFKAKKIAGRGELVPVDEQQTCAGGICMLLLDRA